MAEKNRKGIGLIVTGIILIFLALGLTVYNVVDDARAQRASDETLEQIGHDLSDSPLPYLPDDEMPVKEIDGAGYIAVISIPSLDIELPVAAQWSYPQFKKSPCRYSGTAYNNDMSICAHNYESHFGRLKELSIGDRITLMDMNGNIFNYEVVDLEILMPTDVENVLDSDYSLTLFTCTLGGRTRVTVRCDRIYD